MSANHLVTTAGNAVEAAGNFGSPMQLLILLVIVLLLFGGNRLRNLGGDLGGAIKGFKKAMGDGDKAKDDEREIDRDKLSQDQRKVIEGEAKKVDAEKDKSSHS